MRHILIALNDGNEKLRDCITTYIVGANWPYWHWIDDVWIIEPPHGTTAKSIHDALDPFVDETTVLIFEFRGPINFWGRNEKEAWDWLNSLGNPSS